MRVSRTAWVLAMVGVTVALLASGAASRVAQEVLVLNWPSLQRVEGTVSIKGPLPLTTHVRLRDLIVAPVDPSDTTRLVDAGTIDAGGFGHVTLSLLGTTKGEVGRSGTVGAFLVPDVETAVQAFHERGETLFALRVEAVGVSAGSPYFASTQPRFQLGFPRYRVLLFNTSDKTVDAELHAYLSP
jgi:hypothetical protein